MIFTIAHLHPFRQTFAWFWASVREVMWWCLGILLHLVAMIAFLNHFHAPQPATAAPELIVETLELTLAEVESEVSTEASAQEMATPLPPVPVPDIAPYLTANDAPIALPEPPPPTVEKPQPELRGLPMPEVPLPALPEQVEDLPAITPPPMQPISTPPDVTPPQQATGATARVEQPELVTDLSALRKSYPEIARRNGWEGTVTLRLTINAKGRLEKTEIVQSSGYAVLDKEAQRMLQRARFRNGPGELIQSITYALDSQHSRKKR
jgi:protein TonB